MATSPRRDGRRDPGSPTPSSGAASTTRLLDAAGRARRCSPTTTCASRWPATTRANALLREAGFDRLPTVTASATASDSARRAPTSCRAPRATDRDSDSYSGVDRRRAGSSTSSAASAATSRRSAPTRVRARRDLAALQVDDRGEVARSYLELRGLQERLRVAREQRRQPARDAAARRGASRRRPRHRLRHLARPRAARVDVVARAGARGGGRGHACTASPC